jgi:uncharacterized oligopeptide transporter (OPT) family protein
MAGWFPGFASALVLPRANGCCALALSWLYTAMHGWWPVDADDEMVRFLRIDGLVSGEALTGVVNMNLVSH